MVPHAGRAVLTVLAGIGRARDAPGLFTVVGQNGGTSLVDTHTDACECPDHEYRGVRCKQEAPPSRSARQGASRAG